MTVGRSMSIKTYSSCLYINVDERVEFISSRFSLNTRTLTTNSRRGGNSVNSFIKRARKSGCS